MKKIIITLALLFALTAGAFGQTMVNVKTFATYYGFRDGIVTPDTDNEYYWKLDLIDDVKFGAYEGDQHVVDTAKEWFLAMACGISRIRVTDTAMAARIESVLPSNNPKQRDLQAGAIVFMDVQIDRFLGDTAAVNRHEAVLQYITGRGNATRAEIETFYRNNIRALVSQVVDEEFQKTTSGGWTPYTIYISTGHRDALEAMKDIFTQFFLNPSANTYAAICAVYNHFSDWNSSGDWITPLPMPSAALFALWGAYSNTINSLNPALMDKRNNDFRNKTEPAIPSSVLNDPTVRRATVRFSYMPR